MAKRRPKLAQQDIYSPSTSRTQDGNDDIRLEIRGTDSVRQRHDIPQEIMRQLPSRAVETLLEPINQNGTLRGPKDKKLAYKSLRIRNLNPCVYNDLDESRLLDVLENDPEIENMQVEEVEKLQSDTLRNIHLSLTAKRKLKSKLEKKNLKRKQKKLGCCKQLKYSMGMQWQHFKLTLKDAFHNAKLWKKHMRTIEGNFGSGVASYFSFLRWQLGLNVFYFLVIFLFVVLPALLNKLEIAQHFPHSSCMANFTNFTDLNACSNLTVGETNRSRSEGFSGKELLTGVGSFENSILYYGKYESAKLSLFEDTSYDSPLAYLLANALGLLLILIINARVLAKSHIKNYIEYKGLGGHFYSNKVFAGWDFAITSEKAAKLHSRRLYLDLKEHLVGLNAKKASRSMNETCKSIGTCLGFNLFSLALLCGTGALLYCLLDANYLKNDVEFIREMSVALTVSAITIIVPLLLTFISRYEKYASRQTQLKITMGRALLLIVVVLGILVYFWLKPTNGDKACECWERELGMEIYRLMIVDFLVWNVLYVLLCWIKKVVHNNEGQCLGTLEFEVSWHTWHLLYNQVLCWVGTYFTPFMPLILIIKLIFTFYIKKECVLRFCLPPNRIWKANVAETIFLTTTFVSLISSIAAFGYIITQPNSKICGPFVEFDKPYSIVSCVTQAIQIDQFGKIAVLVIKPGTILFIIVCLCSAAYYARATANAHLKMMDLLRKQVAAEGKDKTYLLYMFDTALKKLKENKDFSQTPSNGQTTGEGSTAETENDELSSLISPASAGSFNFRRPSTSSQSSSGHRTPNVPLYADRGNYYGSRESVKPLTKLQQSPVRGAENVAYYESSPNRHREFVLDDRNAAELLPTVSHQPPFQNFGKGQNINDNRKYY